MTQSCTWKRACENGPAQAQFVTRRARAKYLGITGGGSFLLYLQMHDNPTDLARRPGATYGEEMVLPRPSRSTPRG